jgi:dTDP-4-amino-4,6-dideoxygalactose transaminase
VTGPDAPGSHLPVLPVFDVRAHDRALAAEIDAAIRRTVGNGWFVLGPEVERFETEFAAFLGGGFVVGVASGTDALALALAVAGVGAGDTVITVPNTAVPTASAISAVGARPVFVDIDPATGLIDPAGIDAAVRADTRAVIPVHLYGRAAPLGPILDAARRHGLVVIEDAAQAHGAIREGRAAGTRGDFGCFSFYPSKNLGAYGDGGAVWTADASTAEALRRRRNYGQTERYVHDSVGVNSRLDELQAAILRVKLPHLRAWNERRAELAAFYRRLLDPLPLTLPAEAPAGEHVHHLFTVRVAERARVRAALETQGIQTQIHYPIPIHLQGAYRDLGYPRGAFAQAERWCEETLSLPFSPVLGENDLRRVARALGEALR